MSRELLQRVLKVLKVKRLRLDEHLIPIIVEEIEQELAKSEQESEAYRYAKRLAEFIWAKHYKEESPDWTPLLDVLGVLTQIDNMTCGLELAKPEQASTEPPDYVEPPTSDYHNGWEEGFEAARNLYPKKTKREWYGLSDKDCDKAWEHAQKSSPYGVTRIEVFAKDIERRLKERNNAV
jgi:hypothetical protein